MTDSVDKLASATGLRREFLLDTWDKVRANSATLAGCPRHDFEPAAAIGVPRRCRVCGGTLQAIEVAWYERGLEHGAARG